MSKGSPSFKRRVSDKELAMRKYNKEFKELEERCQEQQIDIRVYKQALPNDICVLSLNEFEVGEHVSNCEAKNKPIFMDELDYEYFYKK